MYIDRGFVHFWPRNRVVITGMGVLAANGIGVDAFWKTILKGESGVAPITLFDASDLPCRIAGEIKKFNPEKHLKTPLKANRFARFTQIALSATKMAIEDAGLDTKTFEKVAPIPLVFGVSTNAMDVIEKQCIRLETKGSRAVSALGVPTCFPQAAVNAITQMLKLDSRLMTVSSGCPAGLDAIAGAAEWIRSGRAEIAIAGASDTPITPLTVASFSAARSLSCRNDEPGRASRPFDKDRDGGVIAEGTGVLILENLDHALARGATPYAELAGYGTQADAPGTEAGSGLASSMELALANAACAKERVDYICAHGPSDPIVDRMETSSIKQVFGERAYEVPVSSIKGVTGNPLSAAGPMQAITAIMSIHEGKIPPTANYEVADPECDLDYVPGKHRRRDIECAVVNTHGIGGTNSTLIIEKVEL